MSEEKLVPKLRFSGFDDEWKKCKLKEISNIQDGTHATPNYTDEGIPFYSVETITSDAPPKFISNEEHQKLIKRCEPKFGDILLTRIGTLAKSKIVDWHEEFSIYVSLALLSEIKINNKFLNQYIQTEIYQKEFLKRSLLLAIPQKINLKDLNETIIKYPSKKEEEKIANFLDLIDKKIELLTHKYKKYVSFKKYLMQQIFTQKLRFDFEDEWETYLLKDIGKTFNGLSGLSKDNFEKGNSKYITYKSIFDNNILKSNFTENVELNNKTQNEVKKGDLFFTGSSETPEEVGMVSVLDQTVKNCYLNSFCFGFRLNNERTINPLFLAYYLRSPKMRKKIMVLAQGSTRFNLPKKEILKLKIELPSINEQEQIINLFQNVDPKLNEISMQTDKLKEFKKGLLQQMFV